MWPPGPLRVHDVLLRIQAYCFTLDGAAPHPPIIIATIDWCMKTACRVYCCENTSCRAVVASAVPTPLLENQMSPNFIVKIPL